MLRLIALICVLLAGTLLLWPNQMPEKRVLFIGNSFTEGADMVAQLQQIAEHAEPPFRYIITSHVKPGASLQDHLAETDPLATIDSRHWDVVVLQDSSTLAFSPIWRENMVRATSTLARAAQEHGAKVLYFAHWAPSTQLNSRREAVVTIEDAYTQISEAEGGQVAPVGRFWNLAERAGIDGLYAEDNHHASWKGGYVTALAFAVALGDVDPTTSSWQPEGLTTEEQSILDQLTAALMSNVAVF